MEREKKYRTNKDRTKERKNVRKMEHKKDKT